jgi:hypothetical protein
VGLEDGGRFGANLLSIRPTASLKRVAPLHATAEVVDAPEPQREHRVSLRVEVVAAERPAQIPSIPAKALPPEPSLDSDAAQLTAAQTAALLARGRGFQAYVASRDSIDANALARGVCVRRDA